MALGSCWLGLGVPGFFLQFRHHLYVVSTMFPIASVVNAFPCTRIRSLPLCTLPPNQCRASSAVAEIHSCCLVHMQGWATSSRMQTIMMCVQHGKAS